jgi:hypothetical protein
MRRMGTRNKQSNQEKDLALETMSEGVWQMPRQKTAEQTAVFWTRHKSP